MIFQYMKRRFCARVKPQLLRSKIRFLDERQAPVADFSRVAESRMENREARVTGSPSVPIPKFASLCGAAFANFGIEGH
jgi:hypothetical protein